MASARQEATCGPLTQVIQELLVLSQPSQGQKCELVVARRLAILAIWISQGRSEGGDRILRFQTVRVCVEVKRNSVRPIQGTKALSVLCGLELAL